MLQNDCFPSLQLSSLFGWFKLQSIADALRRSTNLWFGRCQLQRLANVFETLARANKLVEGPIRYNDVEEVLYRMKFEYSVPSLCWKGCRGQHSMVFFGGARVKERKKCQMGSRSSQTSAVVCTRS